MEAGVQEAGLQVEAGLLVVETLVQDTILVTLGVVVALGGLDLG